MGSVIEIGNEGYRNPYVRNIEDSETLRYKIEIDDNGTNYDVKFRKRENLSDNSIKQLLDNNTILSWVNPDFLVEQNFTYYFDTSHISNIFLKNN